MSNRMSGFDVYRTYLALKMHFTKPDFDFHQYEGKVRAKIETYEKRNDYYFFETLSRRLTTEEIMEYLLASFILSSDPSKVWIGDIKRNGRENWMKWKSGVESRTYKFTQEVDIISSKVVGSFDDLFSCVGGHPPLLRMFIKGDVSLDTFVIMDIVLGFSKDWDKKLKDPLWEFLSFKIKKYKPFLSIPSSKYKKIMKETFV